MAHEALIEKGRYRARRAVGRSDLEAAQAMRHRAFRAGEGRDADPYDDRCQHILIEDRHDNRLVACYRVLPLMGAEVEASYAAQFYDLTALMAFTGPMIEMGRFCIAPGETDPDIIRVAWAALTRIVDQGGVGMLFGCSSFKGTDPKLYTEAFTLLRARHVAPSQWAPRAKAAEVVHFSARQTPLDVKRATKDIPPLLRTYLTMGGWVSDHAVVDRDLGTLHVFTGLEIAAIPPARQRLLRADAL